ncbi:MFS transporter [Leucobacter sp. OH1287]|uniref:MFS transporter n=1 Tax=Leucobacter sp. OH1287 TaxID=2491049 RepID=UPI000F5FE0FF|nr:MFS transporter [Leucobacter sp. OH1287]RRD59680.1 MFS transporter [Leucobacter sp. OH1287]
MLTRTQRLESLPVTKKHRNLLYSAGIGWALDAMDVGLIAFVIAALKVHWELSIQESSWIATAGFIGMALGASLGGLLADRIGRKQVFALTLLVYGLATGASALATSVIVLIVLRFIVGLGLGAELPVASTLMAEFSPRKVRGRLIVLLEAFWAAGWILAAIIGATVVTQGADGWRWALLLGMVPALYSFVIRRGMPESVAFLESQGKFAEAELVVSQFEASPTLSGSRNKQAAVASSAGAGAVAAGTSVAADAAGEADAVAAGSAAPSQRDVAAASATSIWDRALRGRTIALWTIWFCINFSYYGAFIWIPSLLVEGGFDLVKSFQFTLIITLAQLPGYFTAAWLIERIGRRGTLTLFLIGSALGAAGYAAANTDLLIFIAGCVLSFFNLGAWGALYAIGPDLYPTQLRGAGTGSAAGFGRIASIIAPLWVGLVLGIGGTLMLFIVFATAFAIAAAASWLLPEQRGTALLTAPLKGSAADKTETVDNVAG